MLILNKYFLVLIIFVELPFLANQTDSQMLMVITTTLHNLSGLYKKSKKLSVLEEIDRAFPCPFTDTDETAVKLNFFLEVIPFNGITLNDLRLKPYIDKLVQSSIRYNLLYRAFHLNLKTLEMFLLNNISLIGPHLLPSYNQALTKGSVRLFIAADIPIDFSNTIHDLQTHLGSLFIREKKQHVTLLFLGNVDTQHLKDIVSAINIILAVFNGNQNLRHSTGLPGFYLTVHHELFGIRRKVITFDLKNDDQGNMNNLALLYERMKDKLAFYMHPSTTILNFMPHITLGSVKIENLTSSQHNELLDFIKKIDSPNGARGFKVTPAETFSINAITLYESSGTYVPLATWYLN